eukprot:TRINITY_DN26597_c0_g1_i2.p1 TRINITY_DN26597_c0_g1~~TRINITY_DN26597_c0_g1_i2.p1  ORF type:complete len:162 (-),score=28.93 TRINITY_DN26597_c0_g1_i2:283-768(-)
MTQKNVSSGKVRVIRPPRMTKSPREEKEAAESSSILVLPMDAVSVIPAKSEGSAAVSEAVEERRPGVMTVQALAGLTLGEPAERAAAAARAPADVPAAAAAPRASPFVDFRPSAPTPTLLASSGPRAPDLPAKTIVPTAPVKATTITDVPIHVIATAGREH